MKCVFCKGELEQSNAAFTVEFEQCIIVIKRVPTNICSMCGQRSYSNEVVKRIEQIANKLKNSITEVAVVHYEQNAA